MKQSILKVLACIGSVAIMFAASSALAQFGLNGAPATKMTKDDFSIANAVIRTALDEGKDGQTYPWNNPRTGASGSITPGAAFERDGVTCRKAKFVISAGGENGNSAWTLCKRSDGWKVVD